MISILLDESLSAAESHLAYLPLKNTLANCRNIDVYCSASKKGSLGNLTCWITYFKASLFSPLYLHFKFPFLQLSSASCDQSLTTQEMNYVPLIIEQVQPLQC